MISFNYQNINQRNKIGFSAGIELSAFHNIEKELVLNPSRSVNRRGKRISETGILMCNAGGITGGNTNNNLPFHEFGGFFFENIHRNIIRLNNQFKETVDLLNQEKIQPEALIFGGHSYDKVSKDLFAIVKYLIEKHIKHPTVFWGTKRNESIYGFQKNIFYKGDEGQTGTWLANLNVEGRRNILNKDEVLDTFEFVRVSPNDRVKFADTDWISGKDGSLNKGQFDLTIEDVLREYGVDPKILATLA